MAAPIRSTSTYHSRVWESLHSAALTAQNASEIAVSAGRSLISDISRVPGESDRIISSHARTFRFATRFLPTAYRDPTIKLYAFFRTIDDLVDESATNSGDEAQICAELDDWETWFRLGFDGAAPRPEIGNELAVICKEHNVPVKLFFDFLDGMRADLQPQTPSTRADVEQYSYSVASTVGIAMAHLFGATSPQAIEAATRLGIAMQLTNILRDVGGDLARQRVYIPRDLLALHGLSPADLSAMMVENRGPDWRLRSAMKTMIGWADEHYAAGIAGIQLLPKDVRMPILVAARLYQQILRQLEANEYDSLRRRAATSGRQKALEACRSALSLCAPDISETRHGAAQGGPFESQLHGGQGRHAE